MTRSLGGRRALAALSTGALVAVLAAGPVQAAPSRAADDAGEAGDSVGGSVVTVDDVEVPVLATFTGRSGGDADAELVRGAVHGVQRVDGATVLYTSLGFAEDRTFRASSFFATLNSVGVPNAAAAQMYLVDRTGLKVYGVLNVGQDTIFTTEKDAIQIPGGELGVLWGVFPELPASVTEVDVVLGMIGATVARVPVADGALEPVSEEPVPRLGTGWPEVSDAAAIATADPADSTFDLFRRTASLGGEVSTAESTEEVTATLDANVLFDFGSAELTPAAQEILAAVAADIADRGTGEVVVTGHTDSDGSSSLNQDLSEARAASVVAVLQPAAGDGVTFVAEGRGERDPVAENDTPENKQLNRRVTVEYLIAGGAE